MRGGRQCAAELPLPCALDAVQVAHCYMHRRQSIREQLGQPSPSHRCSTSSTPPNPPLQATACILGSPAMLRKIGEKMVSSGRCCGAFGAELWVPACLPQHPLRSRHMKPAPCPLATYTPLAPPEGCVIPAPLPFLLQEDVAGLPHHERHPAAGAGGAGSASAKGAPDWANPEAHYPGPFWGPGACIRRALQLRVRSMMPSDCLMCGLTSCALLPPAFHVCRRGLGAAPVSRRACRPCHRLGGFLHAPTALSLPLRLRPAHFAPGSKSQPTPFNLRRCRRRRPPASTVRGQGLGWCAIEVSRAGSHGLHATLSACDVPALCPPHKTQTWTSARCRPAPRPSRAWFRTISAPFRTIPQHNLSCTLAA